MSNLGMCLSLYHDEEKHQINVWQRNDLQYAVFITPELGQESHDFQIIAVVLALKHHCWQQVLFIPVFSPNFITRGFLS